MENRFFCDELRVAEPVDHATGAGRLLPMDRWGASVLMESFLSHKKSNQLHEKSRCRDRGVACGGFAAEFNLLKNDYAEQGHDDDRNIIRVVFHNATGEREEFWGRKLGEDEAFTEAEDREFMNHAVNSVAPIFNLYLPGMRELVRELCDARRVEGRRVKELLRPRIPR